MWAPSSPDLAPLDYGIWGEIERKANAQPHRSVADLKAAVEEEWTLMSEEFMVKACNAFWPRVEAMLAKNGGRNRKYSVTQTKSEREKIVPVRV